MGRDVIQQMRGLEKDMPQLLPGQIYLCTDTEKSYIGNGDGSVNIPFGSKGDDGISISEITQTKSAESGAAVTVTVKRTDGHSASFTLYNGEKGKDGTNGKDGVSIRDIKQTTFNTDSGESNTVKITFSDGTEKILTLYNGSRGEKGDTGEKGDKGDTGAKGDKGDTGEKGDAGKDGKDISSITQITNNQNPGEANTIRITLADGTYSDITIYNGKTGVTKEAIIDALGYTPLHDDSMIPWDSFEDSLYCIDENYAEDMRNILKLFVSLPMINISGTQYVDTGVFYTQYNMFLLKNSGEATNKILIDDGDGGVRNLHCKLTKSIGQGELKLCQVITVPWSNKIDPGGEDGLIAVLN